MKRLTLAYLARQLRGKLSRPVDLYSTEELQRIWYQLHPGKQFAQMQFFRERERES